MSEFEQLTTEELEARLTTVWNRLEQMAETPPEARNMELWRRWADEEAGLREELAHRRAAGDDEP